MNYVKESHDIGITYSGTVLGLMLARDKNDAPIYKVFDREYLARQYFTGEAGYTNLEPERKLSFVRDDWRSGFGMEYYDSNDSKRYFSSYGTDLRFKGMGILSNTPTTATKPPAGAVVTNATMEATGTWLAETGTGARDNAVAHGGTYSWKVSATSGPDQDGLVYQDLSVTIADYQGTTVVVTGWIYNTTVVAAYIGINDGVTTTWSTSVTTIGAWTQRTVYHKMGAAATRLRIYFKATRSAGNEVAYYDDVTTPIYTAGTPTAFANFNDAWYCAFGQVLAKLNATGTAFTYLFNAPASITALEPFTDSKLYIALGTSNDYWEMTTAEAFTVNTLSNKTFQFFKTVHTSSPTMHGNDGANTIRTNTDPSNGGAHAWSGQTTVGSSYYDITGLGTDGGLPYIFKEDMPYYLNSSGVVKSDLAPELISLTSSTSGKNSFFWKGYWYIPCGVQGLLETDGTTSTFISPASFCTNLSDFVGQVFAVTGDEEYLYIAVDNSTKVEIMAGRRENIDGETNWVWHPLQEITLTGVNCMGISTVYQRRLWIGSTASADSIYYMALPIGYGNIASDTNRNFLTGGYFIDSWIHCNFKHDTKAWTQLTLTMGHTYSANVYITAAYQILGDTTWTTIANFTGSATSMTQTEAIPADSGGNVPTSTMVRFKFTGVTNSTATTPILLSYKVDGVLYPSRVDTIACVVRCAEEMNNKDGVQMHYETATIIAALDALQDAAWPVSIRDIDGNTKTVKALPLGDTPRWYVIKNEKGRGLEKQYNLLLQEVPLSAVGEATTATAEYQIVRTATLVVTASNASTLSQKQADYVCDGVADNVEIQAAIDALGTTGGVIQLSEGQFNTAAQVIPDNYVTIRGMGRDATIIKLANTIQTGVIGTFGLTTTVLTNVTIEDLTIDGNKTNNAYLAQDGNQCGIFMGSPNRLTLRNLRIHDVACEGVYLGYYVVGSRPQDFHIENVISELNGVGGFAIDAPIRGKIISIIAYKNGSNNLGYGLYIAYAPPGDLDQYTQVVGAHCDENKAVGFWTYYTRHLNVSHLSCKNNGLLATWGAVNAQGIQLQNDFDTQISHFLAERNSQYGLLTIGTTYSRFMQGEVLNNSDAAGNAGIGLTVSSSYLDMSRIHSYDTRTPKLQGWGIADMDSSATYITVKDCNVAGNLTAALALPGATNKIEGNIGWTTAKTGVATNVTLDGSGVGVIPHTCDATPTYANVICQSANLNVRISSIDATNINIVVYDLDNAVVTVDTHDFYWKVE